MPTPPSTLFADRGSAVRASFTIDADDRPIVAELCRRLDHLPLALELAAARLRVLPLDAARRSARRSLPRARPVGPARRCRAIRPCALSSTGATTCCSTTNGGCSHGSPCSPAGAISTPPSRCAPTTRSIATDILDLLGRLVDKSLVVAEFDESGDVRYSQLQTLWEYGRERLADIRRGRRLSSIAMRSGSWPSVSRPLAGSAEDGLVWQTRFAAELGNLRGALDWFIERGDATSALSLTTGLAWVWFQRSDFHNAARWLEDALRVTGDAPSDVAGRGDGLARLLQRLDHGRSDRGIAEVSQAVEVLRDGSDPERLADALLSLAALLNRNGDLAATPVVLAEAHQVLTALDDRWGLAVHDFFTAGHLAPMGDLDGAEASARLRPRRSARSVSSSWCSTASECWRVSPRPAATWREPPTRTRSCSSDLGRATW